MSNPLDEVMQWYVTAKDSLRVVRRVVTLPVPNAVTSRHVFAGESLDACRGLLNTAQTELDNLVVLAMVAIFERMLRERVVELLDADFPDASSLHASIRERLKTDVEYWHFADSLVDVFPVSSTLRGEVRQLIRFRNWLAHGHSIHEPPPASVLPQRAFDRLSDFLRRAGAI